MNTKVIFFGILTSSLVLLGAQCVQPTTAPASNSNQTSNPTANNGTDLVVRQAGVISTFPTDVLPLLDKTEAFDSIRNISDPAVTVHEIEYAAGTAVDVLYGKFKTQLTADGWTEQNPQTQVVGSIQMMTGTFTKNADTIFVAVQTAVGDEQAKGSTKVKLKIEQQQ